MATYIMPKCPGCGRSMAIEASVAPPDRPWDSITHSVWFYCDCGWKSPTKYATSFNGAFIKALEAANCRHREEVKNNG